MRKKIKIGFSEIGGIYIGDSIETNQHFNHTITIAVSFSGKFAFWTNHQTIYSSGIIIQPHTTRKFKSLNKNYVGFIHIAPYTKQGLKLINKLETHRHLTDDQLKYIRESLSQWFIQTKNNQNITEEIIDKISEKIGFKTGISIDARIQKSMDFIRKSETTTLKEIADYINLSKYRFSHLFRQETGMSYREFVLQAKLVKSLQAIYNKQNLTHSSYSGGFADQAHFTRTYYKTFGILPSKSVK